MRNYTQCVTPNSVQWRNNGATWRRIPMFEAFLENVNGATMAQTSHLTGRRPGVTLPALAKQLGSVKRRPRKFPLQIIPVKPLWLGSVSASYTHLESKGIERKNTP